MGAAKRFLIMTAVATAVLAATASPGAVAGGGFDVAVCATRPTTYDLDVKAKLVATGLYATVDLLDCHAGTPSLATFQGYDAVLAYADSGFANKSALAQNLKDYNDGGGRLVIATFGFGFGFSGTILESGGYLPFTTADQKNGDGPLTLVADVPGSPLLAGVGSFSGGTSSYRQLVALAAGATLVAHWSDAGSTPLVGYKGNVVGLNFYPPSTGARGDFWNASTDGVRLLTNALGSALTGAQVNRTGYCSVAGNTNLDGVAIKPGTFLDLADGQPASDPHYKGATPSFYYQGLGLSCDSLPGYTKTGELVGYGGKGDPGTYTYMAKN